VKIGRPYVANVKAEKVKHGRREQISSWYERMKTLRLSL